LLQYLNGAADHSRRVREARSHDREPDALFLSSGLWTLEERYYPVAQRHFIGHGLAVMRERRKLERYSFRVQPIGTIRHLEVKMRSGRAAGVAYAPEDLAAPDLGAGLYLQACAQMA